MQVEEKKICGGGNNIIRSGYFVQPRPPRKSETKGQYKAYVDLERFRVSKCVFVGLWCSTDSRDFCNGAANCSERVKAIKQSNCQIRLTDKDRNKYSNIVMLTENVGTMNPGSTIMCAKGEPLYASQLHSTTTSNYGWKEGKRMWESFCRKHKSNDACDEILQVRGPASARKPYSMWAVQVLSQGNAKVNQTEDGTLWSDVQLDLSAGCGMMERRLGGQ